MTIHWNFKKKHEHRDSDVLSHLPVGRDHKFDGEEMGEDLDNVCAVHMFSCQIVQDELKLLVKETSKHPVLAQVMRCVKEVWPNQRSDELQYYKKLADSLCTTHSCLCYTSMVVIPASLQGHMLQLLYLGHFGMLRMKLLAM